MFSSKVSYNLVQIKDGAANIANVSGECWILKFDDIILDISKSSAKVKIDAIVNVDHPWHELEKLGFRCVPVTLTEKQEDNSPKTLPSPEEERDQAYLLLDKMIESIRVIELNQELVSPDGQHVDVLRSNLNEIFKDKAEAQKLLSRRRKE